MNDKHSKPTPGSRWNRLFRIGGVAALLAGILFRRNLGAEITLFIPIKPPTMPVDWLLLLQNQRLLGLAYLGIFDLVNTILLGLMMLALYVALRQRYPELTLVAAGSGFLGIAVYLGSNVALSILSLSDQYAASTSEAQRMWLLSAAQALLALNRFSSSGAQPGSGGYLSLLLIAAAGLIFSILLLRSALLGRWAGLMGIAANCLDLGYCLAFPFSSGAHLESLALLFIPAAGLFFMAWHIVIGIQLLQLPNLALEPKGMAQLVGITSKNR